MPQISDRGLTMPASPIRKLSKYADAAKARGVEVLHLNIGQPDLPTPPQALDAVRSFSCDYVPYSHSAGNSTLRKKMADYYKSIGIDISHEDILITNGGSEAICFAYYSILNYADEVIVPEPFYSNYYGFTTETGARMIPVRSTIESGFALPSIEEFEKALTPRTKAIMLCNPNNPTGYVYSRNELEQIRDLVKQYNLFLICDEVYREFCYDSEHYSVMNLQGIEDNVILVDSFSKRYNVCGIRVGALISRNKDVIATSLKFAQARLSPPSFGQIVAEALLDTPQSYIQESAEEYDRRRKFIINELNKIKGVRSPMPKGAFYSIVELPVDNAEKFCQWLLEEFQHEGATVMLAPGNGFYTGKKLGDKQVRIAYILNIEKLERAIECLKHALAAYPGRTH
ncbi:MAG: pyridoxal phosphate-dependent aminotransferase [Bacteroidales bacterium]|jgi:aspartate aminotransferase|nr:pyridoxal phosphate-dependent aminotransferase [Bacteroidales bacterium]